MITPETISRLRAEFPGALSTKRDEELAAVLRRVLDLPEPPIPVSRGMEAVGVEIIRQCNSSLEMVGHDFVVRNMYRAMETQRRKEEAEKKRPKAEMVFTRW